MGALVEGKWRQQDWSSDEEGRFQRAESSFRDQVRADGSTRFEPASGRYHLYASYACPWAQRTLITRHHLGLTEHLGVSVTSPWMLEEGWVFGDGFEGTTDDELLGKARLHEIYTAARPDFTGRVTVPVLWDKETGTIVNNESREIMRMLDLEFGAFSRPGASLLPAGSVGEVDAVLDAIYAPINNGVYKSGFAQTQAAYEEAVEALFEALAHWEEVLGRRRFLLGNELTEADVAMYTTLVRFDPVYVGHFKCNKKRIRDYPNLWNYLLDLYQRPAFRETTHLNHIRTHYYGSHASLNPRGIIPIGPDLDLDAAHDRDRFA